MNLKCIDELNREFQTEEIINSQIKDGESFDLTGLLIITQPEEPIKLKSLDELNTEFQTDTIPSRQVKKKYESFDLDLIKPIELISPKELMMKHLEPIDPENPLVIDNDPLKMPKTEEPEEAKKTEPDIDIREISIRQPEKSEGAKKSRKSKKNKKKQRGILSLISDLLFYLAICTVLLAVLTSVPGNGNGAPRMFMGYSYFTVLTPSMQNEIPKGSFILVKETKSQDLNIGDNITFMKDANNSVTHKIVDIYENYENSGARGFQTKGVNNLNPDKNIVYEANVIGKVILVLPAVGAAISYIRANIYIVFIFFGLCILLSFLLRGLFANISKSSESSESSDISDIDKIDKIDKFERNKIKESPERI